MTTCTERTSSFRLLTFPWLFLLCPGYHRFVMLSSFVAIYLFIIFCCQDTGGYLTKKSRLVRYPETSFNDHEAMLSDLPPGGLDPILDSLNQLGSVAWIVNKPILELACQVILSSDWLIATNAVFSLVSCLSTETLNRSWRTLWIFLSIPPQTASPPPSPNCLTISRMF